MDILSSYQISQLLGIPDPETRFTAAKLGNEWVPGSRKGGNKGIIHQCFQMFSIVKTVKTHSNPMIFGYLVVTCWINHPIVWAQFETLAEGEEANLHG